MKFRKKSIFYILFIIFTIPVIITVPIISKFIFLIVSVLTLYEISKGHWIDLRIGLLAFSTLYFFGTYINFFYLNNFHFSSGAIREVMENYEINVKALQYVTMFQLGILTSYYKEKINFLKFLFSKRESSPIVSLTLEYLKLIKYGIPLLLLLLIIDSFSLDWGRLRNEYSLESMSTIFYWLYVLFALLSISLIYNRSYYKRISISLISIILIIIVFLNYLGVRQVLIWGVVNMGISYSLFLHLVNKSPLDFKNNLYKVFLFGFLSIGFLLLINVSFLFRHQKAEMFSVLMNLNMSQLFNGVLNGFIAETTFTTYNLLSVVENNSIGNSMFPLKNIFDIFFLFIPSFIFPEKYNYIYFFTFARTYDVTPFGSWYIIGEFASSLYYPILVYFGAFLYASIQLSFIKKLAKKCKSIIQFCSYYGITYVFGSLYVVRGVTEGGVKVGISIFIGIIGLKFLINIFKTIVFNSSNKIKSHLTMNN